MAEATSLVQATRCGQKSQQSLKKLRLEKKAASETDRCSTHTVNVTSLILSKEERKECYCEVMLLSLMTSSTLGQAGRCRFTGRKKPKQQQPRKQCSSAPVSLGKWCNATPQCTLHCCSGALPLKMYNLTEFDTLALPKNSIQKSFSKRERPTLTLILECQCLFHSPGFQKSFNSDLLL